MGFGRLVIQNKGSQSSRGKVYIPQAQLGSYLRCPAQEQNHQRVNLIQRGHIKGNSRDFGEFPIFTPVLNITKQNIAP